MRFGNFEFNAQTGELFKDGRTIRLQPQPVRLLDLLISRAGELVTREELRDALWPAGTVVEFDQGLNFSVRQIRSALGESASNPVFLETLPKRGYRFIGDVQPVEPVQEKEPPAALGVAASVPPPRTSRRYWLAALAVAAISLPASYWLKARTPTVSPKAILIRPFQSLGLPAEKTWYADSLTHQLIFALSRSDAARVVPWSTAQTLKGQAATASDLGRRFEVDVIVEGTVRKVGEGISVTIQVQDTRSGSTPWSKSYEYATTDLARIEKQIATEISDAFRLQLRDSSIPATRRPPDDIEAYNLYRRALAAHDGNGSLEASAEALEEVIQRAPNFAPAYALLANVWARKPIVRSAPPLETYRKAQEMARTAVRLDPQSAAGHTALAHTAFKLHKWREAEREFRLALSLEPNSAPALQVYVIYLTVLGRFDEAIERAETGARLEPAWSLMAYSLSLAHLHAGNYDKAIAVSRRAMRFGGAEFGLYRVMTRAYAMKGRIPEAIATIDEWEAKTNTAQPLWRALVHAQGGNRAAARELLRKWDLEHPGEQRPGYPYALALIELGETDRGFQALRTVAPGESGVKPWMKQTPELRKWHGDPRFRVIAEEFDREPSE